MKRKIFYAAVGLLGFLSMISVDSDSWMPLIMCVVCGVYLACLAWKHGLMYDPERDEAE